MQFNDIIATRRSVRKFNDTQIPKLTLQKIISHAIAAPSSRNSHSTSFVAITNPLLIEQLAQMRDYGSTFLKNAPAAILILADTSKTDLSEVNAAIAATTLQLAITNEGLASCWVHIAGRPQKQAEPDGAQAADLVRELIPLKENLEPLCIIALGYSDFQPAPIPDFDRDALISFIE